MKVMFFALLAAGFWASNCLAQFEPIEVFPGLFNTSPGVYEGNERFPDTAFVVAEHHTAGQHKCSGGYPGSTIADMEVPFVTKDGGLARVTFCGTLDTYDTPNTIILGAQIDGENDCVSIKGVTPWTVYNGDNPAGPICWEWICGVTNDEGRGAKPVRTEHVVTIHCADQGGGAQFNDRSTFVDYTYIHSN